MKRFVAYGIAYSFAIVSALLAAQYGFKGGETEFMQWLRAIALGLVAMLSAHSLAYAYEIWTKRNPFIGFCVAVVGVLLFLVTLAGGTGTMAGSADKQISARTGTADSVRDLKSERDDLVAEKKRLATARPPEAVKPLLEAARAHDRFKSSDGCAADKITRDDTKAHCREFRGLEAELGAAARVGKIEARLSTIRSRLETSEGVGEADPLGASLATLISWLVIMKASTALTAYNFGVSCSIELGAMVAMLVAEMIKEDERVAAAAAPASPAVDVTMPPEPPPLQIEPPAGPSGQVTAFMLETVVKAKGQEIERRDLYAIYAQWCRRNSLEPISFERFATAFATICANLGLPTRGEGDKVYAIDIAAGA